MSALSRRAAARRGLTLLELLIVVGITLAITAIAIPVLIPAQDERRMYEAGREVTAMFSGARAKAIETGRPVGVMLHRLNGLVDPTAPPPPTGTVGVATATLSYAEVPPPYAGGFQNSRVHIVQSVAFPTYGMLGQDNDGDDLVDDYNYAFTNLNPNFPDLSWYLLIRAGDVLKINHQGHLYNIYAGEPYEDQDGDDAWNAGEPYIDVDDDGSYTAPLLNTVEDVKYIGPGTMWVIGSETAPYAPATTRTDLDGDGSFDIGGLPYQIIRQPVVSAGTSVQLPESILIDLTSSGSDSLFFAPNVLGVPSTLVGDTITVLYMPGGTIGSIHWGSNAVRPTTSLFLLLCRREQLPPPDGSDPTLLPAWQDLTNRWIGVNVASGQVTTSENFPVNVAAGDDVMDARRLTRDAQSSLSRSP